MCRILVVCSVILWMWAADPLSADAEQRVLTLAGTGTAGLSGDGGPAQRAAVGGPFGVAFGPDRGLHICEITSHVIRRIDPRTGIITTVAGNGRAGYSGDGGAARKASLNEPYEVRFDARGNMYFVEMKNHIVRRVDARSGVISTVAGTGQRGFSGDGGPATQARLSVPHSITLDDQHQLYICDIGNHRIRRVDLKTGIISTFCGTGERRPTPNGAPLKGTPLNGPRALDFDGHGSLLLALREGNAVYRIDLAKQTIHHVAGTGQKGYSGDGGPALQARLSGPKGIAVAGNGDVYLADTESHTVRVIRKATGIMETVIGDGRLGDGPDGAPRHCRLARPHGVFVDDQSNVYVGDSSNHRVRMLAVGAEPRPRAVQVQWKRIQLDAAFRSEGVAAADVNHDGAVDVLAGDVWYAAPKWTMHEIRKPGAFVAGKGYSNSFANFAYDVNRDGWDDFILIGFPGDPFHWYENPRNKPGHWKQHLIWHSACNESPEFEDLTGDGIPELILGSQPERQMGFIGLPAKAAIQQKWQFHAVSAPGDPKTNGTFKYYLGLGVGDVNNDGRKDVLIPNGWWKAPANRRSGTWKFHPYVLSETGAGNALKAANIHLEDLHLDGDQDLLLSSAHTYGVWWFENIGGNAQPAFKYHLIDKSYSQTHALEMVDVDGDGDRDLVTGKRFFAHNGSDPGGKDAVVMFWYEVRRTPGQQPEFIPHEIVAGRDTGIGTQFEIRDMNADGRPDIVLSNKKGVNLLIQQRR